MRTLTATALCATVGLLLSTGVVATDQPATAAAAAPAAPAPALVYEGHGWDLMNEKGLRSLGPSDMVITFTDAATRDRLRPYVAPVAAQLTDITGTRFTITDQIAPMPDDGCAKQGTIAIGTEYQPLDKPGYSWGGMCYDDQRALHSGKVLIDTEWFTSGWFGGPAATDVALRNGVAHELGHAVGLTHPNVDLDGDHQVEDHECPRTADGALPLMCSPNGGYRDDRAGQFTPLDEAGLRALTANHTAPTDAITSR